MKCNHDLFVSLNLCVLQNVQGDSGLDSDNDDPSTFKIELTKAEEEALARGLQVCICYAFI